MTKINKNLIENFIKENKLKKSILQKLQHFAKHFKQIICGKGTFKTLIIYNVCVYTKIRADDIFCINTNKRQESLYAKFFQLN